MKNYFILLMAGGLYFSSNVNAQSASEVEFLYAAEGNIDAVRNALARGMSVKTADADGITALHIASLNGQNDIVKLLLASGTPADIRSKEQWTPLMLAAGAGKDEAVRTLIAAKADVNTTDSSGDVPLSNAAQFGHLGVVKQLLAAHANPNAGWPRPVLHYAAHGGHADVVAELLRAGADAKKRARDGSTPLHEVLPANDTAGVDALINAGGDVNAKDDSGKSVLHAVIKEMNRPYHASHPEAAKKLIEKGANVTPDIANNPLTKAALQALKKRVSYK